MPKLNKETKRKHSKKEQHQIDLLNKTLKSTLILTAAFTIGYGITDSNIVGGIFLALFSAYLENVGRERRPGSNIKAGVKTFFSSTSVAEQIAAKNLFRNVINGGGWLFDNGMDYLKEQYQAFKTETSDDSESDLSESDYKFASPSK